MPVGKNHDIKRGHSKRCSKTSLCAIDKYFWDNPIIPYLCSDIQVTQWYIICNNECFAFFYTFPGF